MLGEELDAYFSSKVLALKDFVCFLKEGHIWAIFLGNLVLSSHPYYSLAACTFQFTCFSSSHALKPTRPAADGSHHAGKMAKLLITDIRIIMHISVELSLSLKKKKHHTTHTKPKPTTRFQLLSLYLLMRNMAYSFAQLLPNALQNFIDLFWGKQS